ncbi:hypothetical protein LQZ18_09515 [Lachnospiraceae bacterium ZAX-1]
MGKYVQQEDSSNDCAAISIFCTVAVQDCFDGLIHCHTSYFNAVNIQFTPNLSCKEPCVAAKNEGASPI